MKPTFAFILACSAGVLALACSSSTEAPAGAVEQEAIEDVETILRLPDGRFDVRCRDGRREVVTADDLRADRVCRSGGLGGGVLLYGRSDSCSGSPIAAVRENTRCESLGTDSVWSISVNGECSDVPDTNLRDACTKYKGALGNGFQIYSRSDSCSGEVGAWVNASTNCDSLGSGSAWSVKKNGVCTDIRDTTLADACRQFQGGIGPSITVFGRSDSCSGEVAAFVNASTNCSTLGSGSAWSVKVEDQCFDITDTTVSAACEMYRGAIGPHVRIYGRSDSCSGEVSAFVNSSTDCETLSSSASAWSIFADGRCTDISDTNLRDACRRFGGGH
jgi:hypothetical protein